MQKELNNRLFNLDVLRGIAVLTVFFSHTSGRDVFLVPGLNFHGIGHIGVYLFFTISSYLMLKQFSKVEFIDKGQIIKFYIKRFIRILPLYYFILLLISYYQRLYGVNKSFNFVSNLANHLFLVQGDGVFWSIVVELQFYILCPLIILLLRKRVGVIFLILISLLQALLYTSHYVLGYIDYDINIVQNITPHINGRGMFLDVFIIPMILHTLFYSNQKITRIFQRIGFLSFLIFTPLTYLLTSKILFQDQTIFYGIRFLSIVYAIIFYSMIIYFEKLKPLNKNLIARHFSFIGKIGFSMYLIHFTVIQLIKYFDLSINGSLIFLLTYSATIISSFILFKLIEEPSIKLYRQITS